MCNNTCAESGDKQQDIRTCAIARVCGGEGAVLTASEGRSAACVARHATKDQCRIVLLLSGDNACTRNLGRGVEVQRGAVDAVAVADNRWWGRGGGMVPNTSVNSTTVREETAQK